VERKEVIHESQLKLLDILSLSLPFQELAPSFKKILKRNDIIVGMNTPIKSPPPAESDWGFGKG
jgi:glycerophosphoryl diester phosphodiesterase